MDADQERGARLRDAREDSGRTVDEAVAEFAGRYGKGQFSRSTLNRWENGHGWPSLDILIGLCRIYGAAMEDIDPSSAERTAALFAEDPARPPNAENPRIVKPAALSAA